MIKIKLSHEKLRHEHKNVEKMSLHMYANFVRINGIF